MATGSPYVSSTSVVDSPPSDVSANAFIGKPLLREDKVQNAVEFMSHPKVMGSPTVYRRSFLEKKCLTKEEIDEAFRRVPDLPSNATIGETYATEHVIPQVSLANLQHQGPIQTPQSTPVSVVSLAPNLQQPMFNWSQAILAAGVLAASGAEKIIPRFKVWIKKIVGEEIETKEDSKDYKLAKEATEAAKAAAAAAVAKASEELVITKTEERKYYDALMGTLDVQLMEIKSVGEAICRLESRIEATEAAKAAAAAAAAVAKASEELVITKTEERKYYDALMGTLDVQLMEIKSVGEAICRLESRIEDGFSVGSITNELSSHVKQSDHIHASAISNTNFEEVCSPLPLALVESLFTSSRSSDTELREGALHAHQQSGYASQSKSNDQSSTKESYSSSSRMTENDNDASEPWLSKKRAKISEVEHQVEKKRINDKLKQRGLLPPRPAAVVLPEASNTIRRPKLLFQQQLSGDGQSIAEAKNPASMPFGTSQRK